MLTPSGVGVDDVDRGAGRLEHLGAHRAAGTVRAIEDHAQATGRDRARKAQPMVAIAIEELVRGDRSTEVAVPDPAELLGAPDQLLELVLDGVVELEALLVEDLEAVVVCRVVRGRDHDPGREVTLAGEERQRGGRDDADLVHVGAEARRTGSDRGDEHVAGSPGVLAHHQRAVGTHEPMGRRAAERVGQRRLQVDVRDAADSIGAEEAGHAGGLLRSGGG